jgi:hypothetical protein
MLVWLHKASLPGHPKLCWRCWRLISNLWAHRTTIGVCQLLKIGMLKLQLNPDIIRNNSKTNQYNSDIIEKIIICCDIIVKIIDKIIGIIVI